MIIKAVLLGMWYIWAYRNNNLMDSKGDKHCVLRFTAEATIVHILSNMI
jgi:hypothetical protein